MVVLGGRWIHGTGRRHEEEGGEEEMEGSTNARYQAREGQDWDWTGTGGIAHPGQVRVRRPLVVDSGPVGCGRQPVARVADEWASSFLGGGMGMETATGAGT